MMSTATAHARELSRRPALRDASRADLLAERDDLANELARYSADLLAGDWHDGDAGQLRGGIALYLHWIEEIDAELARRDRARAFGYREAGGGVAADLAERFAAARSIDCADVLRLLAGDAGKRAGQNWLFRCPFHDDRTPSLTAYPAERGFYCFGCGAGGDAVALVARYHDCGMVDALRLLESGEMRVRLSSAPGEAA